MTLSYLETVYIKSVECLRCHKFETFLRNHRAAVILSQLQDLTCQFFYTSLMAVSFPLFSITFFGTIRLHGIIDPTLYVIFPAATFVGFSMTITLTCMASMPYENLTLSRPRWLAKSRLVVNSLSPARIHLGPYSLVKVELGIRICDDLINNTVSLLCLYESDFT